MKLKYEAAQTFYGILGEPTPFYFNGEPLHIGDMVIIRSGDYTTTYRFVVEDKKGAFIMGIRGDCNSKTGEIKRWEIVSKVSWKKVQIGDKDGTGLVVWQ